MEANYSPYNFKQSIARIDEILIGADNCYVDQDAIPSRDKLTFNNGYYVPITVVFIDMRGSKNLMNDHTRPVLAKIYRAFISELVAVLKGNEVVSEVYIEGDGVWAVYNTTNKAQVRTVFSTAVRASSLVDILNIKLKGRNYSQIKVGIGIDDGPALYIKAGHNGSGINEVVWIGEVVGRAAALCKNGQRSPHDKRVMVSNRVYEMLNDERKELLSWSELRKCWHGSVVNTLMDKWVTANAE